MTGIVLIEITFDGTPLWNNDGTLVSNFTKGWPGEPPVVRGENDVVASREGQSYYPRLVDYLDIGLAISVQETTEASFRQAMRALFALFQGDAAPTELEALLEDGATATINAYAVPPILVREIVPGLHAELDVALTSVDPRWAFSDLGS